MSTHLLAALLVIDVQESFRHAAYWREDDVAVYLAHQNRLIAGARAAGIPIVRVFHADIGVPEYPHFDPASGYVIPMAGSDPHAEHTVQKQVHSAMVGTGLVEWLHARGIKKLIISGIRSEQCCETTTRNASDLGFQVDYVTEATLTFPMRHFASGRVFEPAEIKERTELVLEKRFARICTVAQVLGELHGSGQ
ncbi:cysteine hydrolase family protein [Undibacterium sp.]|jgi:nicotinamidase-related amidase|uniref:cysteine hydrolase family protein n=1 Tax=Undibacterium sp. TaxID=1914977 RepID=UPI002BCFF2EA|nr:isochorismatase family protein [Undibacterium sp.]HTD02602.1 isochorismatase family protein [Undibacterium sp.]